MVRSIRDSGEFRESKGFGVAGPGLRDEKQKERGRQAGKELKEALERGRISPEGTEYTGKLADTMMRQNIDQFNRRQLRRRALEDAPERLGFGDAFRSIGRGITGLTSQLSPQRIIGSLIGNALLPGIGGLLGGIIGGTYADDDESNNFFGNVGASLKKDITDTINFFRPEEFVTPPLTESTPSMFPIQNVTATTGMPGMEQIPDMFPDNFGVPTFTPEAAGFGIDSLMQPQQNETFTMPERNKFMDYGTMPRVTSAPLGTSSTPINAVDLFGNPITSGVSTFDPSVEVIDLGTADREITPGTFSSNLSFEDIVNALQNK
jgi:hypothetical protein